MYSMNDLTVEIEQIIEAFEQTNERRLHPEYITNAVIDRHPDVSGADAEFYRVMSRAQVREAVRSRLNAFKAKAEAEADRQLVMQGFERLQRRYLVNEDGTQVAVKVEHMTSKQRQSKVAELRAMGQGCFQHADELERFDRDLAAAA